MEKNNVGTISGETRLACWFVWFVFFLKNRHSSYFCLVLQSHSRLKVETADCRMTDGQMSSEHSGEMDSQA